MKVVFCWDEFDHFDDFTHFALGLFYTKVKPNKNVFQIKIDKISLFLVLSEYLSNED